MARPSWMTRGPFDLHKDLLRGNMEALKVQAEVAHCKNII